MVKWVFLVSIIAIFTTQGGTIAESSGLPARANASGEGIIITGPNPYNIESNETINGTVSIEVNNVGDRGSPLQNIDAVTVKATFSTANSNYEVLINEPMINHINGRDPTWFGVVYNQKMYGETNTITNELPEMEPDIAIWGWADVYKDGKLIQSKVPAHVIVMQKMTLKGITLKIGLEKKRLSNIPDGYLHINFPNLDQLELPDSQKKKREWLGWSGLILLNLWFGWLAIREPLLKRKRE